MRCRRTQIQLHGNLTSLGGKKERGIQQSRHYILIRLTHLLGKHVINSSEVNFHGERVAGDQARVFRLCWKSVLKFTAGNDP